MRLTVHAAMASCQSAAWRRNNHMRKPQRFQTDVADSGLQDRFGRRPAEMIEERLYADLVRVAPSC
jgi:hypothetical protein